MESSAKFNVPVAPYNMEIPNSNKPDEKAEDIMNFMAASDERLLSKSKLAIAANGMLDNSRPR